MRIRLLFVSLAWMALLFGPLAHAVDCRDLATAALPGAAVNSATLIPAGPFEIPSMSRISSASVVLPSFCRVQGTAVPMIGFELWLPARHWNGRLLSLGNGGFGGSIDLRPLAEYLREGYAVTANDTGHVGSGTAWMHDPKALLAWGHDATHRVIGPARALVRAYYGKPQSYSYFQGCSTGGAEAMEEAEFYPTDFNGIVAESPGMDYSDLMLSFLWGLKSAHDHAVLSQAKLELIHRAALKKCDDEDGLRDGLLGRPLACRFRPETLLCRQGRQNDCLTPQEVKTAELIYQGPRNPRTHAQIYPGFVPGSEAGSTFADLPGGKSYMLNGWTLIQGPLARQYAVPLLKNMVFGEDWDWTTFNWDSDVSRVDAALGARIDSMDPNLQSFQSAGGKLLMLQGWDDPLNAAALPIQYRRAVIASFGRSMPQGAAIHSVNGFFRLFMAPGMSHCSGGDGPSKVDALGAVRAWVERERPPAQLIATKVLTPSGKPAVPLTRRPLCPFPRYARYFGGDPNQPQSFRCVNPDAPGDMQ